MTKHNDVYVSFVIGTGLAALTAVALCSSFLPTMIEAVVVFLVIALFFVLTIISAQRRASTAEHGYHERQQQWIDTKILLLFGPGVIVGAVYEIMRAVPLLVMPDLSVSLTDRIAALVVLAACLFSTYLVGNDLAGILRGTMTISKE